VPEPFNLSEPRHDERGAARLRELAEHEMQELGLGLGLGLALTLTLTLALTLALPSNPNPDGMQECTFAPKTNEASATQLLARVMQHAACKA